MILLSYRPQCSCSKVMFLHLSVILSIGGVYPSMHWGRPPGRLPPRHPPGQTPPSRRLLQPTVRILLECILVLSYVLSYVLFLPYTVLLAFKFLKYLLVQHKKFYQKIFANGCQLDPEMRCFHQDSQ